MGRLCESVCVQRQTHHTLLTASPRSHTWHPTSAAVPLGPPVLMTSTTDAHPGPRSNDQLLAERKEKMGIDTAGKEQVRKDYLDHGYQKVEGADDWEATGKARVFEVKQVPYKQEDGSMSASGNK